MQTEKSLTKQQSRFVTEYLRTLDVKAAAQKAGYSPTSAEKQGDELLKRADVIKEINMRLKTQAQSLIVGKSYIVMRLLQIVEFSLVEEELTDKEGYKTGKTKLKDPAAALRAIEALTKHLNIAEEPLEASEPSVSVIENLDEKKL